MDLHFLKDAQHLPLVFLYYMVTYHLLGSGLIDEELERVKIEEERMTLQVIYSLICQG